MGGSFFFVRSITITDGTAVYMLNLSSSCKNCMQYVPLQWYSLIFKSIKVREYKCLSKNWYNSKTVYVLLLDYSKEIKLLKFPAPFSLVPTAQYIWTTLWYDMQTFALTRRSRDCSIFKFKRGWIGLWHRLSSNLGWYVIDGKTAWRVQQQQHFCCLNTPFLKTIR